MLGLISTLSPILYKYISDRREELDNIREANTFLLLKEGALDYIEANKEGLSIGTTVITPTDIGIEISGYKIGIRKESDGTVEAMIAPEVSGTDLRAGKIASLLGVSAGIYSEQDSSKAWGINGIWAEDISNYGFSSLPTGIPVVTTAYDKEDNLNLDKVFSAIEEHEFEFLSSKQVKAEEFCLKIEGTEDYDCISSWDEDPIKIILQCNADLSNGVSPSLACTKGWGRHLNRSCSDISRKYKEAGLSATSGLYAITTSEDSKEERACYFVNGELPTAEELIRAVKTDAIARRYDWENGKISSSCQSIIRAWEEAPTDFYTFVSGKEFYTENNPCAFTGNRVSTAGEVQTECNETGSGISAACQYGWIYNYNRSCSSIIQSNPTASSKYYYINSSQKVGSSRPCYFIGDRL